MGAKILLSFFVFFMSQQLVLTQQACVSNGNCAGQSDGRIADCSDCKSYFLCESDALVIGKPCPSILFFNPSTMKCDLEENVVCATTSAQSVTSPTSVTSETSLTSESYNCITGCYGLLSGFFASCDSCEDYFDCPTGSLNTCPSGQLFDSATRNCQPDGLASCLTTSATSETSATSVTSGSSPSSKTSLSSETSESSATSGTSPTSINSESPTTSPLSQTSQISQTSMTTSEAALCLVDSCGNQPDGYYSDCYDCQSYLECAGGVTTKITCSATLLYNSLTMLCDLEANVVCDSVSRTSGSSPSSMTSFSSESSRSSRSSASSPSSPTSLTSETSEAIYCVTGCAGTPDGQYPNCDDCSSAITCTGQAITNLFTCPSPLVINPDNMNCDFIANVVCATTTTSSTSLTSMASAQSVESQTSVQSQTSEAIYCLTSCAGQPDGRFSSCSGCADYFNCEDGVGSEGSCASGLQFNPLGYCDLPNNVVCATTSAQSVTSGSSPSSQSSESSEPSLQSDQSATSATSLTSRSSQSSESSESSASSESSPTSLYSPTSEAPFCVTSCDGVPAGFWADCNDCSMYYVCGLSNREYDCTPLLYNPATQRCALVAVCATTSGTSMTSVSSDSSPSSVSSQTSITSVTSKQSITSGSSPSSGSSPTSITSITSEQSETSSFSLTSETSTKPFCLTACIGVDGIFADCNDCRSYLICTGSMEEAITCDSPLFFNPDTEQCSFTENCQTTSATSETSASSQTSRSSATSMSSESSMTSVQSETSDQSETSGTSMLSVSSESSITSRSSASSATSAFSLTSEKIDCATSCDGLPVGQYADCSACESYYDCATTFTKKTCESGLNWEADNMRCGVRTNLCYTTSITSGSSATSLTSMESMTSEEGSGEVIE